MAEISVSVDQNEVWRRVRELFLRDPDLAQEVFDLFFGKGARYEPAALGDYLFIDACAPAPGTDHQVVGFRLRDANERQVALATLKRKQMVGDRHGLSPE